MGKFALLIGVGDYDGKSFKPLAAAPRDAAAVAQVLADPAVGGFTVATLLNPTRDQLAETLEVWLADRRAADTCVVFFSGHGVKDDQRDLYFAATNTRKVRERLVTSSAVSARSIYSWMNQCRAQQQVMILDCCFSGAFGDLVVRDDGVVDLQGQLIAEATGRVVLTSTSSVDYSFERKGEDLSIYTRYWVEGLRTGAADLDNDGAISVDELHRYTKRKVQEAAPAMEPQLISLREGEGYRIVLARSPQDDPRLIFRKAVEDAVNSQGKLSVPARRLLARKWQQLGLSQPEAEAIIAEVRQPFLEYTAKLADYRQTLVETLQEELQLCAETMQDLHKYQQELGLRDEDVAAIQRELLGYVLGDGLWLNNFALTIQVFEFEIVRVNEQGSVIEKIPGRAGGLREKLSEQVWLEMVRIPAGQFWMGQTEAEKKELIRLVGEENYHKWYARELPGHQVTVPEFYLGRFPVTQTQWRLVAEMSKVNRDLQPDPAKFKGDNRPVERVSWDEAVEFCDRLTRHTKHNYRLPTEAEWEYACRAGTDTPFYFGETITPELVNYNGNSTYGQGPKGEYRQQTTEVGQFSPNAFGLYDMHGNVWEWCQDIFHPDYNEAPIDGSAWVINGNAAYRLLRGGSWGFNPRDCRSAYRSLGLPDGHDDNLGFRLACSAARTL
ncbi:caspase, EACC1-associated type [Trichothermofontia sp.]